MTETITLTISALGLVLLALLASLVVEAAKERKLSKHRSKDASVADLLNYAAMVDDGVIVGKNGSFVAGWIYQGDDNASSTDEQREAVSFRINQALSGLGNGWMIHVDAVRRPAPSYSARSLSKFPDAVTSAIDEERRRLFERMSTMYEGYFVLTVTYFPPLLAQRQFVELMFDDDEKAPDGKTQTKNLIEFFKRECCNIESRLSSAINLTPMRGHQVTNEDSTIATQDDLLSWLQFCITGLSHPMQLPSNPMYLDCYLGGQELWGGVVPKIGKQFIQVAAIEGFPLESTPGILTALAELPITYRWSSRFIFLDSHEAIKHLDEYRKKWRQKIRGIFDQILNTNTGPVDEDAVSKT